jgi:hypothetical protein
MTATPHEKQMSWMKKKLVAFSQEALIKFTKGRAEHGYGDMSKIKAKEELKLEILDLIVYYILMDNAEELGQFDED